jgi:phenylacetate-CoA ligase
MPGTSSYALLLAEEVLKRNLRKQIHLKIGIIGSERWGDKMRSQIAEKMGVEPYDIYGLTEIYGPGIGMIVHCTKVSTTGRIICVLRLLIRLRKSYASGLIGELVITTLASGNKCC